MEKYIKCSPDLYTSTKKNSSELVWKEECDFATVHFPSFIQHVDDAGN